MSRHIIDADASRIRINDQENANRPASRVLNLKHDIIDADELQMRNEACLGRLMI